MKDDIKNDLSGYLSNITGVSVAQKMAKDFYKDAEYCSKQTINLMALPRDSLLAHVIKERFAGFIMAYVETTLAYKTEKEEEIRRANYKVADYVWQTFLAFRNGTLYQFDPQDSGEKTLYIQEMDVPKTMKYTNILPKQKIVPKSHIEKEIFKKIAKHEGANSHKIFYDSLLKDERLTSKSAQYKDEESYIRDAREYGLGETLAYNILETIIAHSLLRFKQHTGIDRAVLPNFQGWVVDNRDKFGNPEKISFTR